MRRPLLLLGPIVVLMGSLGLFMFGHALVGVFDVLTYYITDPPAPLPSALAQLNWTIVSASALVIGLVISSIATVMPDSGRTISMTGKLLCIGAGVSLMAGSLTLAWGIMGAKGSFRIIATSESTPTAESIQEMSQSAEATMTVGYAMVVLSAVLLLAAGLGGFQASLSQAKRSRAMISIVFAAGSVVVGLVLLLLFLLVWFNGNAIEANITEAAITPKPAELAAHLAGILNTSLFAFLGLTTLGLLQFLFSLSIPSARPNTDSEPY